MQPPSPFFFFFLSKINKYCITIIHNLFFFLLCLISRFPKGNPWELLKIPHSFLVFIDNVHYFFFLIHVFPFLNSNSILLILLTPVWLQFQENIFSSIISSCDESSLNSDTPIISTPAPIIRQISQLLIDLINNNFFQV